MCDRKKRRFKCTCTSGYTGHRCQLQGTQLQSHLMQEPQDISLPLEDPPYHSPPTLWAPAPAPWFTSFVWTPALRFTSYLTVPAPFTSMQESQPAPTPMLVTQPSLPPRPCRDVVTSANKKKKRFLPDSGRSERLFSSLPWLWIRALGFMDTDPVLPFGKYNAFKHKAFFQFDKPINQDAPEWDNYRL